MRVHLFQIFLEDQKREESVPVELNESFSRYHPRRTSAQAGGKIGMSPEELFQAR
jgi:hypothetical protein